MTDIIDESKPTGADLISSIAEYIRENRVAINSIYQTAQAGTGSYIDVILSSGETTLDADDGEILGQGIEIIGLTGEVAVSFEALLSCLAGTIKIFVAFDDNVTLVQNHSSEAGGTFFLNSPANVDFAMTLRDAIVLFNVGGDGDDANGYWLELFRKTAVI